jgi:ABC-2 type transport system permease protein
VVLGAALGVPLSVPVLLALIPVVLILAMFGGAFGILVLSNLRSQQAANQIFPFVMLPQFFLAGVFNPIHNLPWYLDILSHLSPMRYAIDLLRDVYYGGLPDVEPVALLDLPTNLAIIGVAFVGLLLVGTTLFVRSERNR